MKHKLFKNKYRVESCRLKGWDYSREGLYFITACTKNRELFFGDVKNNEMILNNIGQLAKKYWQELPAHFDNSRLDEFIIMPNHVHGIIVIDNTAFNENAARGVNDMRRDEACLVPTDATNRTNTTSRKMQKISPKPKSLSVIVGSFKSTVTRKSKIINPNFAWQPRFYDHIIRNEKSLNRVRQYIIDNPKKWERDRDNAENLWM